MTTEALSLRALLTPGWNALRLYWRPFVALQAVALLLVIGYYTVPAVRDACDALAGFRERTGLWFSAAATMVSGAILPEAAKAIMLGERRFDARWRRDFVFMLIAFAGNGIITDYQYRLFAWLIGNDASFATAVKKMLVDQFVTTPLWGTGYWILMYDWRANRYRPWPTLRAIGPGWYVRRVLPLLLPCWGFWIPMVLLIYSLPGPLQFCLFALALAAWSLVMVAVSKRP